MISNNENDCQCLVDKIKKSRLKLCRLNVAVFFLFFIVTASSLGVSIYSLYKVQQLSQDITQLKLSLTILKSFSKDNIADRNNEKVVLQVNNTESTNTFNNPVANMLHDYYDYDYESDEMGNYEDVPPARTLDDPIEQIRKSRLKRSLMLGDLSDDNTETEDSAKAVRYGTTPPTVRIFGYRQAVPRRNPYESDLESGPTYNRRNRMEMVDEFTPTAGRLKSLAAIHLSGDTSKYNMGHPNYNGNGHLRHPKRTFVDWKESDWVKTIGMNGHFTFENGMVTVREDGLYLVYAQIYYLDEHDTNGYRVFKNSEVLLQCTTTSHSEVRIEKPNTCYTGGVAYLESNDNISIGDIFDSRYSLFATGKSFFGIVKLGDVKVK